MTFLEGGKRTASILIFRDDFNAAADPLTLVPLFVIAMDNKDHPIGNTGYFLRWRGSTWQIEK